MDETSLKRKRGDSVPCEMPVAHRARLEADKAAEPPIDRLLSHLKRLLREIRDLIYSNLGVANITRPVPVTFRSFYREGSELIEVPVRHQFSCGEWPVRVRNNRTADYRDDHPDLKAIHALKRTCRLFHDELKKLSSPTRH